MRGMEAFKNRYIERRSKAGAVRRHNKTFVSLAGWSATSILANPN